MKQRQSQMQTTKPKKPITFTLELAGNAEQVAAALRKIAQQLERGQKSGMITDEDNDVVGTFWLELAP